jgi:hypothetical protein
LEEVVAVLAVEALVADHLEDLAAVLAAAVFQVAEQAEVGKRI